MYPWATEQLANVHLCGLEFVDLIGCNSSSDLASKLPNLTFKLPNPCLTRVFLNNGEKSIIPHFKLLLVKPILLQLSRKEVTFPDLKLLRLCISGEIHPFHPIEKRAGYPI